MKTLKLLSTLLLIICATPRVFYAQTTDLLKKDSKNSYTGQTSNKVVAREITLKMATSTSGFANPNTPFLETGGRDEDICYPMPFRSHIIREKPVDIDWRIVVLENEFLRVEFAPELGGMIWRLYDKVHNQDVLHAPGKVSPTADGFGGTYTPGGWNSTILMRTQSPIHGPEKLSSVRIRMDPQHIL